MRLPFTPNHVRLIQACYPASSALLTAAPGYNPNSQELSRLTYYGSNHPGKLAKVGHELERRGRLEANRARLGSAKSRSSLLITLAIFKALVAGCRSDISLITSAVISTLVSALSSFPVDLEVAAKCASLFTAWTTYTDGQLIGIDTEITANYKILLKLFASLSRDVAEKGDGETRNRRRLVGIAALTGVVNSDALYHATAEFSNQVSIIVPGLLFTLKETEADVLKDEAAIVKHQPSASSAYLSEFRPRPLAERRAASIHIHVDGDRGPSFSDVVNASLRAFHSLLERGNAHQVSDILQAVFQDADQEKWWSNESFCCWLAQTLINWTQYQYRYAVPKKLVDKLALVQDAATPSDMHFAITSMINTVFTSSTPLINLSTSDMMSYLLVLLIRRTSIDPMDELLAPLINCIASLGTHVYYQDQIHDLVEELVGRLVSIQVNGILGRGRGGSEQSRERGMRCLLAALRGLFRTAGKEGDRPTSSATSSAMGLAGRIDRAGQPGSPGRVNLVGTDGPLPSRRTRVSPEIWQDSLALLCEVDYGVRSDYARALVQFIRVEMLEEAFALDNSDENVSDSINGRGRASRRAIPVFITVDPTLRFLNALHASAFNLATSPTLGLGSSPTGSLHSSTHNLPTPPAVNIIEATPSGTPDQKMELAALDSRKESPTLSQVDNLQSQQAARSRPSVSFQGPRARKASVPLSLLDRGTNLDALPAATPSDYIHIFRILTSAHERLPGRALLTGVPMLLALQAAVLQSSSENVDFIEEKKTAIQELLIKVWAVIAKVWGCEEVAAMSQKALKSLGSRHILCTLPPTPPDLLHSPEEPLDWASIPKCSDVDIQASISIMSPELIVQALASNSNVHTVTGLDRQTLLRRLAVEWTIEFALKDSVERQSTHEVLRGDGSSPFLKLSPALMHIENLSLQSLARSQYGIGVHDLREALEGRASTTNLSYNMTRPPSIRTLEQPTVSSIYAKERLALTRSNTQTRAIKRSTGDVKDVLSKLGVGKEKGTSRLKASFPALHHTETRYVREISFPELHLCKTIYQDHIDSPLPYLI
ncbi:hypothetical protein BU17DRAFT_37309 [Hysterangium stoloniferum]|nr:hypothetical protein BU17DRAFT_37309 [Hysterangium stoloniferum]